MTLQFFTFFPAIYSTYNSSARKNRAWFSHVRVCGLGQTNFLHQYMPIYNRGGVARLRTGVVARIAYGYILSRVNENTAQIGIDGATRLWWNLHSQIARLVPYKQIANRQLHIILRWKNVWMNTNLLWKMRWMSEYSHEKMWMMLTSILMGIMICAWK